LNRQSSRRVYWNCQSYSSRCVDLFESFGYFISPKSRYLIITKLDWSYHGRWSQDWLSPNTFVEVCRFDSCLIQKEY
jgi:hypothetical protein